VDPKTGIGLTRRRNVTALAPDGTDADWLATACSVLSWRKSKQLIRKIPGAALLVTEMKNGKISRKSTSGFRNYLQK
jgi:thiamine biosynthesis lipoprotein